MGRAGVTIDSYIRRLNHDEFHDKIGLVQSQLPPSEVARERYDALNQGCAKQTFECSHKELTKRGP